MGRKNIPADWITFERLADGDEPSHREVCVKLMAVNGDEAWIDKYAQEDISSGLLLGGHENLDGCMEKCFSLADDFFNGEKYLVLPPQVLSWKDSCKEDNNVLPSVLSMAEITTCNKDGPLFSTLRVMWWQAFFGSPSERAVAQIKTAEWHPEHITTWDM